MILIVEMTGGGRYYLHVNTLRVIAGWSHVSFPGNSLGDNGTTNYQRHHLQCPQLQTALARVPDELEKNQNQKKII